MKLAVMQPYFMPYLGYFQLIHASDKFVFYDDVNFIKKGWINRNRILINGAPYLFTIPCKKVSQNKLINEVKSGFSTDAKKKFLKRISLAYKKAPQFNVFYPQLEYFIMADKSKFISELAASSIVFVNEYLDLKKVFLFSSKEHSESRGIDKQERLKIISKKEGASILINLSGGKHIYSVDSFKEDGLKLEFLTSINSVYSQNESTFVPWLSIIDVLMFNDKVQSINLLTKYNLS